jgi:uncharacterized protein YggE
VVTSQPDQAQMDVGVVTRAPTAQAAAEENARKLEAVLAALRKALDPAAEIKTVSYTLSPNYVYPREGGEPKVTGYVASNTVRVRTTDLKRVGAVIDAATQAGANDVQNLQFSLKNDSSVQAEALRQAAAEARAQAEAMAAALNVKVLRVLFVDEVGATVRPFLPQAMEARVASDAQTPVEPGTVEVRATVSVTVEIGP